ncbi:hypothetical protein DL93DRAFT_2166919 [Clavulina sp. PMI_390]|nr:hypothetical protein DL93DRAFT_2166919 [Clavulina sp. PMI_390]
MRDSREDVESSVPHVSPDPTPIEPVIVEPPDKIESASSDQILANNAHNSQLPIHRLPKELFLEILMLVVYDTWHSGRDILPFHLSSVCRIWRVLTLEYSGLWAHVPRPYPHSTNLIPQISDEDIAASTNLVTYDSVIVPRPYALSLSRAGRAPLSVSITQGAFAESMPLVAAIQNRIGTLEIFLSPSEHLSETVPLQFSMSSRQLKHLMLIGAHNIYPGYPGEMQPLFVHQQSLHTLDLRQIRQIDYTCFSPDALVEATFASMDFDDRVAEFLSSCFNLRVLGWSGGNDVVESFSGFIELESLRVLSVGSAIKHMDLISTSWFLAYVQAPNLVHLDFVISRDIDWILPILMMDGGESVFPSVRSLRLFGVLSKSLLREEKSGMVQEDLLPRFIASFPALSSLHIAFRSGNPVKKNYILRTLASFLSLNSSDGHPLPNLQSIHLGYSFIFGALWRSTLSGTYEDIMTSLLPQTRPIAFPHSNSDEQPPPPPVPNTGNSATPIEATDAPKPSSFTQGFTQLITECGAILEFLPHTKVEVLVSKAFEDERNDMPSWLKKLGGWDILEKFGERLRVVVAMEPQFGQW